MLSGNFTPTAANQVVCPNGFNSTNTNWCNNLAGTVLPDGTVVPDNGARATRFRRNSLIRAPPRWLKSFPAPAS